MTIQTYKLTATIGIHAENRNWAGALFDPSQGVVVNIFDPDGELVVDGKAMTPGETGNYDYYHTTEAADPTGGWRYECWAVDGTGEGEKRVIAEGSFYVQ